jgi:hypothetical protein
MSAEPPSHRDCAEFAVWARSFLIQRDPGLQLSGGRTIGLPEDMTKAPELGLQHNPGVIMLWITKTYRPWQVPEEAIRDAAAIEVGLPHLRREAAGQGPRAVAALLEQLQAFERLLALHIPEDREGVHATNRAVSPE